MSFTLGNVKSAAQARGYGTDSTTAQTEMVCAALRRLYGMRRWKFLETTSVLTTAVGNGDVTFGSIGSLISLDAVRLSNGSPLEFRPMREVRDLQFSDTTTDTPELWTRKGSSILLWPLPDAAYELTIEYATLPTLPAADTSTITWPQAYEDILVESLCADLAFRQRDWQAEAVARLRAGDRLRDMLAEYAVEQRQNAREVPHWSGWDD